MCTDCARQRHFGVQDFSEKKKQDMNHNQQCRRTHLLVEISNLESKILDSDEPDTHFQENKEWANMTQQVVDFVGNKDNLNRV